MTIGDHTPSNDPNKTEGQKKLPHDAAVSGPTGPDTTVASSPPYSKPDWGTPLNLVNNNREQKTEQSVTRQRKTDKKNNQHSHGDHKSTKYDP